MNVENIKELAGQIRSVGFENVIPCLVRRICFHPAQFLLSRKVQKGSDTVVFHFHFQRFEDSDSYELNYYDAVLQKQVLPWEGVVNGIDISQLEKRMAEVDWKEVFCLEDMGTPISDEKKLWAEAELVESIMGELARLEVGESELASALKQKFWTGTFFQEFTGSNLPGKGKTEISQRFYMQDGSLISSDEAYRFLQNRWLERELQQKKKMQKGTAERVGKGAIVGRLVEKRKKRRTATHQNK